MDSLQRMSDRPLSSSSLSLSLGQMSGINHLGTTEEQHMCSHCSCAADAIRQQFRELNQLKAGSSMQKELGAQPSSNASTKAAGRWGGGQAGEESWLLVADPCQEDSAAAAHPQPSWGRGDALGVVTCLKH